jgi:hypothetical protein
MTVDGVERLGSVDLELKGVGPFARRGRPTVTRLVGSFQNR